MWTRINCRSKGKFKKLALIHSTDKCKMKYTKEKENSENYLCPVPTATHNSQMIVYPHSFPYHPSLSLSCCHVSILLWFNIIEFFSLFPSSFPIIPPLLLSLLPYTFKGGRWLGPSNTRSNSKLHGLVEREVFPNPNPLAQFPQP